jgi:hypothetical protein
VSFTEEGQRVGYEVKVVRWMAWNTEADKKARDSRGEACCGEEGEEGLTVNIGG